MTTAKLRRARDEAFDAYLQIKKAGGTSSVKRARLINLTLLLHRRERVSTIERVTPEAAE